MPERTLERAHGALSVGRVIEQSNYVSIWCYDGEVWAPQGCGTGQGLLREGPGTRGGFR